MRAICSSDIHGNEVNFRKLCAYIRLKLPEAVFIGGDALPNYYVTDPEDFIKDFLSPLFTDLKSELNQNYPDIYLIPGNDDAAICCEHFEMLEIKKLLYFLNKRVVSKNDLKIIGYPFIPPTPFLLKDWEKYDISRYVPRDAVSPEDGIRTIAVPENIKKFSTIKDDLNELSKEVNDFRKTICLFHAPPVDTNLDKIYANNINGEKEVLSVGSYAIRKFIERNQPLLTLHGHIHESTQITTNWQDKIGNSYCFNSAHLGNELAVIEFDTDEPGNAVRILI
ncbi:MAG: metallophosphoesterase [Ignavibacteria bacterium]